MKSIMVFQLVFFILYGSAAGSAFSYIAEKKAQESANSQISSMLLSMPIWGLSEIQVRQERSI